MNDALLGKHNFPIFEKYKQLVYLDNCATQQKPQRVIEAEGKNLLDKIGKGDYVIALDVKGKELSSEEMAGKLSEITFDHSSIIFIIGGSLGLSEEVKRRADLKQSFGRITLPHQLARVVALEQIYRAFKINAGETYHK